jgi:hypothetical protein
MEQIVPRSGLCVVIEPRYPKAGRRRSPAGPERMLRKYFGVAGRPNGAWFVIALQTLAFRRPTSCDVCDWPKPNARSVGDKLFGEPLLQPCCVSLVDRIDSAWQKLSATGRMVARIAQPEDIEASWAHLAGATIDLVAKHP